MNIKLPKKSLNKKINMEEKINEIIDILGCNSYPLYVNNGLYLHYDSKYILINIEDLDSKYIKKLINNGEISVAVDINSNFFNIFTGEYYNGGINVEESEIITLPMTKIIQNSLPKYNGDDTNRIQNMDIIKYDNEILRYQFFNYLRKNGFENTLEYYLKEKNLPKIEKNIEKYKIKVKNR